MILRQLRAHGERDHRNGRQTTTKEIVCLFTSSFFIHLLPSSAGDETAIITWSTESKKGLTVSTRLKKLNELASLLGN